ncbi:MAG: YhbY family RNA-binding protein [Oscillospiraceae bacterium]|nr:YhbY family RNA-binding protein [Oscillospiraceae bacterium]MBP1569004.1 YhbY family RNA-binding protein [Oscillospiraceae bacterium]MBP1574999.1 YhbY family RNA-binding protein [Oscillospiraceae bacterium]MBQ5323727.1 YhbY family RNA-binding protein [Oscillospiraceae bacterium]MBQ8594506.1 YhbY family RNA-binding protein [Oscillospiraceae bacterium]
MITTKQRAYLRSLANGIPSILQVGKEGVTEALIKNVDEALNAREIVKVSVLETSPVSSKEAIEEVMNGIKGCEAVQVIGRKFVVYKRNLKEPKIILP